MWSRTDLLRSTTKNFRAVYSCLLALISFFRNSAFISSLKKSFKIFTILNSAECYLSGWLAGIMQPALTASEQNFLAIGVWLIDVTEI